MTTAILFSRQTDAGSGMSITQYWENLVLVVVLVSESKALYYETTRDFKILRETSVILQAF